MLLELDDGHAVLEPAAKVAAPADDGSEPGACRRRAADGRPRDGAPTKRPAIAEPALGRLEFRYFDDATALARPSRRATSTRRPACRRPRRPTCSAAADGARALRSPGTTLTTVLLNLRPDHPELRDPAVRTALLAAIDRPAIIDGGVRRMAPRADAPIPPTSWAFDRDGEPAGRPRPRRPRPRALTKAGWTKVDGQWRPAKAPRSHTRSSCSARTPTINPTLHAIAERVAADWEALGLTVELVELDPGRLADRRPPRGQVHARPSSTSRSASTPTSIRCSPRARPGPAA